VTRYRLIYTRGVSRSWYVYGTEDALAEAQRTFEITGIPIMVVETPKDGCVARAVTVGAESKGRRR
jgi:intergrase/recombinase